MINKIINPSKLRVVSAISGGVDSCVATILLKQKGFNVVGVYMNNWSDDDEHRQCQAQQEKEDAKFICNKLDIEFKEINFFKNYWNDVFSHFINGYQNGQTPNPDVLCNKNIKFGVFLKHCIEHLDADVIATGHYAGNSYGSFWEHFHDGKFIKLLRPIDKIKDQTLFLSQISQSALKKTMFPLQNFTKNQVKKLAIRYGFEKIAHKDESTGICFIGKRNFKTFIENFVDSKPGNCIDIETNKIIGSHKGIHYWTIGERCRFPGLSKAYYVIEKNVQSNDILVAPNCYHPRLFSDSLITNEPHWICEEPNELKDGKTFRCLFRFQHKEQPEQCEVIKLSNKSLKINLFQPKRALTPGQYAVIYNDNECLGSAIIQKVDSLFSFTKDELLKELIQET